NPSPLKFPERTVFLFNDASTLGPALAVCVHANQRRSVGEAERQRSVIVVVTAFWAEKHNSKPVLKPPVRITLLIIGVTTKQRKSGPVERRLRLVVAQDLELCPPQAFS